MRAAWFPVSVSFVLAVACTDPVNDAAVDALGPEQGPTGGEHRPGQPCVLCHREGGPAANAPFAVAGTVYETRGSDAGASSVDVHIVSAHGEELWARTNRVGNFYIDKARWDPVFPLSRIEIGRVGSGSKAMHSSIGREPSCAGCHFNPKDGSRLPDGGARDYELLRAVPPIYLEESP